MASPGSTLILVENMTVPFDRRVWMEATTLRSAGYEVNVISPMANGWNEPYEVIDGVHVYRHPLDVPEVNSPAAYAREYWQALSWEFRLARRIWRERPFDVIHLCNPPDLLFVVAAWFKHLHGVRVIFDQHDISPELYEAKFERRDAFYQGLKLAERMTYATADLVVSTNESYRRVALTRGRKRPDDVAVVRSAPDLELFFPTAGNDRYRRGRSHLVGYLGDMGEKEGVDYLLRAVDLIVHTRGREDISFVLVGGGQAVANLMAMTERLRIGAYVEFAGRVPDKELIGRLSTCDMCVDPGPKTPFNDFSTMNKIVEYMALGKPVVQFDLVEGRRSAGAASLYARPNDVEDLADKILELIDDPAKRVVMGAEARRRMTEELEWKHQAPRLLDAYRKVLSERR